MYRKRATLITISSLKALFKVSRLPCNYVDSIKPLGFVRNLSTAAESSNFYNHNGENSVECEQNPGGFYSESRNRVDFQHTSSRNSQEWGYRGDTGEFQKNPCGFYPENTVGVQQNSRIEFRRNPVGQNLNFPGGSGRQGNRTEFQANLNEQNGGIYTNYHRDSPQNSGAQFGNFRGNTESLRTSLEVSNGSHGEQLSESPYGSFREGQSVVQQNPGECYGQRMLGSSGGVNGHYGQSPGQFQLSAGDHCSGNTGAFSQQKPNSTSQQNPDNYYSGSSGMSHNYKCNYRVSNDGVYQHSPSVGDNYLGNTGSQQNINNTYMGNTGMTQQRHHNFYRESSYEGSNKTYHQSMIGYHGQSIGSANGFVTQNVGEDHKYPIGTYKANVGNYWNSNEPLNATLVSQVTSNSEADRESIEGAECSQNNGAIEELDDFCKEGKLKEAVELLGKLERQHVPVSLARYLMLMKACGEAKALQEAKSVHEHLLRSVPTPEVATYNNILEMYGKCGLMDDAFAVFDTMPRRNMTSWDTMVTWLAKNGLGEEAIDLFTQFKKAGLKPDGQMFIGVFSALSVLGDTIEGMLQFESMSKDYDIVPTMEHYVCVVDVFGSAGYLEEALEFVEKMPVEPSIDVWETLMNHARVYGHVELGDRCAELVELLDPSRLNEQSKAGLIPVKASDLAKEREKKKLAAENLLSVRSKVHEYRAGDTSHPEKDRIYALLRGMKQQMKEAGYIPETRFVLHDIDQEGKEDALLAHSERLAVAYGLLSSPARAQIRIIKNLRVCGDCHSALKIISKLVGRELVIRDAKRFHHFKDGLCSCRDYW